MRYLHFAVALACVGMVWLLKSDVGAVDLHVGTGRALLAGNVGTPCASGASAFWVGGTGQWQSQSHWASTSGGAGGACVPGAGANATFDGNSGTAATVTNAKPISVASITINKSDLTLKDSAGMTISGAVTLTAGTLDVTGQTENWGSLSSSNSNTRTLTITNAIITISTPSITAWNIGIATGMTRTATGSTISMVGFAQKFSSAAGGTSYGSVIFTGGNKSDSGISPNVSVNHANTFVNLSFIGTASGLDQYWIDSAQTVTGTFTATGKSTSVRVWVLTSVIGTNETITAAAVALTNVDFTNITGAGGATWAGTSVGDFKGNSGVTFTTPKTVFWVGNTGNWSGANWATSSGGSGSVVNFPLPQDTITFDGNSFSGAGQIITQDTPRYGTVDFTGATNNPTFNTTVFSTYYVGNLTLIAGMICTGSVQHNWFHQSGTLTYTSNGVKIIGDIQLIQKAGAILSLGSDANINENLIVQQGTFTANNHNITLGAELLVNSAQTRVINMGSGNWIFSSAAAVSLSDFSLLTGLTLNPGTSTVEIVAASPPSGTRTFNTGGLTWNNFSWPETIGTGTVAVLGGGTFADFNLATGTQARTLKLTHGVTYVLTTFELAGSSGNLLSIISDSAGNAATVSVASGLVTASFLSLKDNAATGGATFTATSSVSVSNVSGWIVTAFLLKRDLDPSANDNTPLWLDAVG